MTHEGDLMGGLGRDERVYFHGIALGADPESMNDYADLVSFLDADQALAVENDYYGQTPEDSFGDLWEGRDVRTAEEQVFADLQVVSKVVEDRGLLLSGPGYL